MEITPISNAGGARINGIDLSEDVSPDDVAMLKKAFLDYGVLVIPGQELNEQDQLRFCNLMGGVASRGKPLQERVKDADAAYEGAVHMVTNLTKEGVPLGSFGDGEVWFHHDGSFKEIPYAATVLYGMSVTSVGGETVFANMYLAYDYLNPTLKQKIEGLEGLNIYDYASIGRVDLTKDVTGLNQWIHPLVIVHPDTGRKALFVSPLITARVEGVQQNESERLLTELCKYQENPDLIFEHKWEVGDVVMMDNRCITHARRDFPGGEPRLLRRTMIEGKQLRV
mgnify:CR=1 FL=1